MDGGAGRADGALLGVAIVRQAVHHGGAAIACNGEWAVEAW